MKQMRIFLACADEQLKIAMLMLLDHQPDMVVAGITDRFQSIPVQVEASQPDVLVMVCEESMESIANQITNVHKLPCPPVIIFLSKRAAYEETIMAAGADYFILKNSPPDELISILNNLSLSETNKPGHETIGSADVDIN